MNLLYKLEGLKIGDRVTLYKRDIYGELFEIKATIESDKFDESGYKLKSGGWGLYNDSEDDIVCYALTVRLYKERGSRVYRFNYDVVDIKSGW